VQGTLAEGWIFTPARSHAQHLLTDGEIFGWKRVQPRQRARLAADAPESEYIEFEINDILVHIDHGIGRYKGLVKRAIGDSEQEYLCVEYSGGDQLYVPVHQADRLSRYIGAKGHRPTLGKLGGVEWRGVKSRVKRAVQQVAEDLLELYARRQITSGYAFSSDTPWQKELEASFPYVETQDQLRVLAEVKGDMESSRPMDRLICGDVGFGKTEVALRAAFKAVMDGRQVALLVPTTVLAQQHFYTFSQRLAAFPAEVEMLSRFRTPVQQREILYQLEHGAVDILIGTHRLLGSDVIFKDLGLLIIDEEQRFGVTHKEHLKKLRTEVDVLTMTATPIPRTLYMALTGVRDISTINTPPEERLPVVTHVGPFSTRTIRQAIVRELERGGQVFFVHNRVHTIESMRAQIEKIAPDARITVAHGQMKEDDLAERMRDFAAGEVDVLLSTSIIESGLDIPNANTLIVDRADTFGLAQLYQLRGRVGRGAQRAYAYFFRHKTRGATEDGLLRLETLAENTHLGAGFSIAMRDLEIRGAGDFLGTRQHGQIASVGLNLYTRLLSQAVEAVKKHGGIETGKLPVSVALFHPMVNVDLPISMTIPESYVPDKDVRLRLYRRLADIHEIEGVDKLHAEFTDRFGSLPEPVENILYQLRVKIYAEKANLASVSSDGGSIVLNRPETPDGVEPPPWPGLPRGVRAGTHTLWMPMGESWREDCLALVGALVEVSLENA
jgi:transcription-repair coupling factor (superfamily II helicase)